MFSLFADAARVIGEVDATFETVHESVDKRMHLASDPAYRPAVLRHLRAQDQHAPDRHRRLVCPDLHGRLLDVVFDLGRVVKVAGTLRVPFAKKVAGT